MAEVLLTKLYLDPRQRIPPLAFSTEMRRYGLVTEDTDVESMARWAESAEQSIERLRLEVEKAKLLREMVSICHQVLGFSSELTTSDTSGAGTPARRCSSASSK